MGRPRKPSNVLELSGAFRKNPQRRREEPAVEIGLGPPPDYFEDREQAVWAEIAASAPEGVLAASDRVAVEMLARLIVRMRNRETLKAAEMNFMLATLSRIGMTPADRSRVAVPKEEEEQIDIFDILGASQNGGAA